MENKNLKLDSIIDNLRKQKPALNDSDILTESIMNQIALKNRKSNPVYLLWIRAISSSAAALLVGLFFYLQVDSTEFLASNSKVHLVETKTDINMQCLENGGSKRTNLLEVYFCYMKSNTIKNQRFESYYQQLSN